jgi:tetratricopeptide (TPR) repeat protein
MILCVWAIALASVLPDPGVGEMATGDALPALSIRDQHQRVQDGIDMIYRLQLEEAQRHFSGVIDDYPDHPLGYFFLAMTSWWWVLLDLDDHQHDEVFYARLQDCIDVCDARLEIDEDDFDAVFFKGGAIGFRGRLRGDRDQFLRAARDGLRCLPLLKHSRQLAPDNKDVLFGQGLYDYFADVMPRKYPVIRHLAWLLVRGDRERGLQRLQEAASSGQYARTEAQFLLAQIYRLFEDDPQRALTYLVVLRQAYPENAVFHRYTARTLAESGSWNHAVPLYREVIEHARAGRRGYHLRARVEAQFYLGKSAFLRKELTDADIYLAGADSLSLVLGPDIRRQAVRKYASMANLYLGMTRDELGQRESALSCYARVRQLPDYGDCHKWARKFQKQAYSSVKANAVSAAGKAVK